MEVPSKYLFRSLLTKKNDHQFGGLFSFFGQGRDSNPNICDEESAFTKGEVSRLCIPPNGGILPCEEMLVLLQQKRNDHYKAYPERQTLYASIFSRQARLSGVGGVSIFAKGEHPYSPDYPKMFTKLATCIEHPI